MVKPTLWELEHKFNYNDYSFITVSLILLHGWS